MEALKISEKVYWVGVIDWNVRDFHGYHTPQGTTYNAYLVLTDKITLIDTVKEQYADELFARIRSVIGDESRIDYIISNHSEPDHSGALPAALERIRPEKVFASTMGAKNLKSYYGEDFPVTAVKTGDSISLGSDSLSFVETRMLHWPDSMFSYLAGEKMLFSQDAFGMHLAGSLRYADEYPKWLLDYEASKYYANILLLYSEQVGKLLELLPGLNLDIQMLLPDHGPIWRKKSDIEWIIGRYRDFVEQKRPDKALIVYATMWKSTEKMARALADGLISAGVEAECLSLSVTDRSEVIAKMMYCGLLAMGAPTMNNRVFPSVADVLNYVGGLRPKNKLGFAFGSYGWSGESIGEIAGSFTQMGFEQPLEPVKVKYAPTSEDLQKLFDNGKKLGELLKNARQ